MLHTPTLQEKKQQKKVQGMVKASGPWQNISGVRVPAAPTSGRAGSEAWLKRRWLLGRPCTVCRSSRRTWLACSQIKLIWSGMPCSDRRRFACWRSGTFGSKKKQTSPGPCGRPLAPTARRLDQQAGKHAVQRRVKLARGRSLRRQKKRLGGAVPTARCACRPSFLRKRRTLWRAALLRPGATKGVPTSAFFWARARRACCRHEEKAESRGQTGGDA